MSSSRLSVPSSLRGIELVRVRLPLVEPFVAAHGIETDRDVVLVHLIGEERDGWGECSTLSAPTYTDEYTEQAWHLLAEEIAPDVLARRGAAVEPDSSRPMAWCAMEVALADLTEVTPFRGGDASGDRTGVRSTCVIGKASSIGALCEQVRRAEADGYQSVKLKIDPGWDVEPLAAVRERAPSLVLAADANGSYESEGIDRFLARDLQRFGLAYLEQPFAAENLDAHAGAVERSHVAIALDESVASGSDLMNVIDRRAANIINVKPARLGGLGPAHAIAVTAVAHGLSAFVGGMLETGVGRSAALRLAARPIFELPTDLGPSNRYFADDITDPIDFETPGFVRVPDDGTLVRRPVPERLAEVTVDRVVIGR